MLNSLQRKAHSYITNMELGITYISGAAGTGKTFLLSECVKSLVENNKKVLILSPTHQALKVVKKAVAIPNTNPNVEFKTVASALCKILMLNEDTAEEYFSGPRLSKAIHKCEYLFVDEISAVSNNDFEVIKWISKTKPVVLFGDFCQLLPVGSKSIKIENENIKQFNLVEQMRNLSSIEEIAEKNRHKVYIPKESSKCGNIEKLSHDSFFDLFLYELENSPNPLDISYLAYTNNEVDYVSEKICQDKFPYLRSSFNDGFVKNGDCLKILDREKLIESTYGFEYEKMELLHLDTNSIRIFNSVNKESQGKIDKYLEGLMMELKSSKDKGIKKIIWNQIEYLRSFSRFTSPFALTVHKSQGSTFKKVFVNCNDILKSTNRKRLLYVAFSRAQEKLYLVH